MMADLQSAALATWLRRPMYFVTARGKLRQSDGSGQEEWTRELDEWANGAQLGLPRWVAWGGYLSVIFCRQTLPTRSMCQSAGRVEETSAGDSMPITVVFVVSLRTGARDLAGTETGRCCESCARGVNV